MRSVAMAVLQHVTRGNTIRPATRCLVGRGAACHLQVSDTEVSREHAVVFHDGAGWKVRDLSSRNGTTVDGAPVRDVMRLDKGNVVAFGGEQCAWRVVDAGPPSARAVCQNTGRIVTATATGLLLPSPEDFEAFLSIQSGQWLMERDGQVQEVNDQELVSLTDGQWRLELTLGEVVPSAPTATVADALVHLTFTTSPDEEHVQLTIARGTEEHIFEHRSHTYLLLLLARARVEDYRLDSAPEAEQGWVETKELARQLRTTAEQVNVWVWRAREQIQRFEPDIAQRLVERRPTLGQLRLGFGSLTLS